jgi:hypothetical protein
MKPTKLTEVNAAFSRSGNDLYSNTYNLVWRNHPNFSWEDQALGNLAQGLHNQAPSNKHPYQPSSTY